MKILVLDTLYPEFLDALIFDPEMPYEAQLASVMSKCFGTFDACSRALRTMGWDAVDIIVNSLELQHQWNLEYDGQVSSNILQHQIAHYRPDVIFLQDLNIELPPLPSHILVAGQCSCPMPPEHRVRQCQILFTSFPHYVERFRKWGITAVYNPLAFDPIVLDRTVPAERSYDVVFVGGVGNPGHWRAGMQMLERVARDVPSFRWWGYGFDQLPINSRLRDKYQGPAWGLEMYQSFRQAKIVVNRHGEVAEGYANNMRLFEVTGMGAALVTEAAPNLEDFFACGESPEVAPYADPLEAVDNIQFLLTSDKYRADIAQAGQRRTLKDHTYAQRMLTVSEHLMDALR